MNKQQDAWVELLDRWDWPITVNLNYKSGVERWAVEEAALHFWNCIDRCVYGRRRADAGRKLSRFCVLDGSAETKNWHYHCAVKKPPVDYWAGTTEEFCTLLEAQWASLRVAGNFAECSPVRCQEAWLKYICRKEVIGAGEICQRTTVWPGQKFPS